MSTVIFNDSFTVGRPYIEDFEHPVDISEAGGARRVRKQQLPDEGLFKVYQAVIKFPRNTLATWSSFWAARKGPYDSWLYLPVLGINRSIADESIGTGDGATTDFALDCKYIKATTLVAKVDAGTVSASIVDNNTAPKVRFAVAPANGTALTASYDRYIPCAFDVPAARPVIFSLASTDADSILGISTLTWSQDRSGSHLV